MENLMAKSMTERYAEYLHTGDLVDRAAENIYSWVMSTLESNFWGLQRMANFDVHLYATEQKIIFAFCAPTGKRYEFEYYSTHNCQDGNLPKMLQRFVEIFNNTPYPLSDKISSPVFRAYYFDEQVDVGKYKGYYHINILVGMLPDADDDPANHGIYA